MDGLHKNTFSWIVQTDDYDGHIPVKMEKKNLAKALKALLVLRLNKEFYSSLVFGALPAVVPMYVP